MLSRTSREIGREREVPRSGAAAAQAESIRARGQSSAPPRPKRTMNGLESEYAMYLEWQRIRGEIDWWAFEHFKVRLAQGAYYTPDFAVVRKGLLEFHETKGFWREAARVRIKVAAEHCPIRFVAVRKAKGGAWRTEVFQSPATPSAKCGWTLAEGRS